MPNDAKLGLVLGVAMVLLIAILFFRREPATAATAPEASAAVKAAAPGQVVPALLTAGGPGEAR